MYNEILLEMIREADISRDLLHYESLRCIDRRDWKAFQDMHETVENMHQYIMTIISML